ncbi:hypothetical protein B296_00035018 [Ensete ventricosum]|uniref:Uncharacterized protein n=1 Tax=Ensete ventricosum TaxID=4639 RepID=A0A426WZ44_ENSVE|nr:hypothetical protein B296_00035018 [Ensete ventricosum]
MYQVDAVGNSLGVHRELVEGIGSLLGWRKEVRQKKIETSQKIIEGSRKAWQEYFRWLTCLRLVGKLLVP